MLKSLVFAPVLCALLLGLGLSSQALAQGGAPPGAGNPKHKVAAPAVGCAAKGSEAECLACCLDQWLDYLSRSREICTTCNFSLLGWCISKTKDLECFKEIKLQAAQVHESCKASCDSVGIEPDQPSPDPAVQP